MTAPTGSDTQAERVCGVGRAQTTREARCEGAWERRRVLAAGPRLQLERAHNFIAIFIIQYKKITTSNVVVDAF